MNCRYVERPALVHKDDFQGHSTEEGYSQLRSSASHVIINDATLEDLFRKVDDIIKQKLNLA